MVHYYNIASLIVSGYIKFLFLYYKVINQNLPDLILILYIYYLGPIFFIMGGIDSFSSFNQGYRVAFM